MNRTGFDVAWMAIVSYKLVFAMSSFAVEPYIILVRVLVTNQ